ncbi:unnamed protein product [Ranitomeya imitator]|uniref:DNA helicase n=1 Tax=Ranitomeya imitator TaxID=111125 RepID=A0ABN9ME92_9NEOB|nr:unnamed protein product [Ranitomeya imitator]
MDDKHEKIKTYPNTDLRIPRNLIRFSQAGMCSPTEENSIYSTESTTVPAATDYLSKECNVALRSSNGNNSSNTVGAKPHTRVTVADSSRTSEENSSISKGSGLTRMVAENRKFKQRSAVVSPGSSSRYYRCEPMGMGSTLGGSGPTGSMGGPNDSSVLQSKRIVGAVTVTADRGRGCGTEDQLSGGRSSSNGTAFYVYSDNSPFVLKVQAFEKFFTKHIELYDKDEIERKGSILVDYKELLQDNELASSVPLTLELKDMPEKILDCMGLAIHQVLTKDLERHAVELQEQEGLPLEEAPIVNVPYIHARVYNYDPLTALKNLRANLYGKYVALRGTVVRVSNIKPLCTKMAFVCNMCGDEQSLPLPDGKYTIPTKLGFCVLVPNPRMPRTLIYTEPRVSSDCDRGLADDKASVECLLYHGL